ncbi:MAG: hypothetical protein QNL71_03085 [Akkermansiaceae bacterium]
MLQFPKHIKHSKSYKKIAYFLTLGFAALFLSSCCGFGVGCGGKIVNANEDNCTVSQTVTKYKTVTRTVTPSAKGGLPYEVSEQVGYEVTEKVKKDCMACGSIYCATPDCCGTVGKSVLRRATAQNGTGEPHIGTIPTMKILAK